MPNEPDAATRTQGVLGVLAAVGDMSEFAAKSDRVPWEARVQRWSNAFLVTSAILLVVLAAFGSVHSFAPLPYVMRLSALVIGILVQLLALASVVLQIGSGAAVTLLHLKRYGEHCQLEFLHDQAMAGRLASCGREALEGADAWIAQKIKRMERRQLRFVGGSDKIALAVMMTGAWSVWKEMQTVLTAWEPSPLLFGVAFLSGLVLAAMALAQRMARLSYQRDVLQIALEAGDHHSQ